MRSHTPNEVDCATGQDWHACTTTEVIELLDSSLVGLNEEVAAKRRGALGENRLPEAPQPTALVRLFAQLRSPLTIILLLAFLATLLLNEYTDAAVIFCALAIAVILGLLQEGKASRAFVTLLRSEIRTTIVVREGKQHEVPIEGLVPGDIVEIKSGAYVPADIRILSSKNLAINEASLTGEWLGVEKDSKEVAVGTPFAERSSMAYRGTFVAEGWGVGVVVATGVETAIGAIAQDLATISDEQTPIQWEMARISRVMVVVISILVIGIFSIGLLHDQPLEMMLLTAIAIAVAAVPEGLPAAVTIILAIGMESLLRRGGLVRNLLAAETLGSTTYILTDKTGTLTEARMTITDVVYQGCISQKGEGLCNWEGDPVAKEVFDIALCATDAYIDETGEGGGGGEQWIVRGTPVERAVLEAAQRIGITTDGESARARRVAYLAFESENKFAAGLTTVSGGHRICINGAPEVLLAQADRVLKGGHIQTLTEETRAVILKQLSKYTTEGKRLIAIAYRDTTKNQLPDNPTEILSKIVFVGLLVIADPVRVDVRQAIAGVLRAGVAVRLVTGDNPQTALAIAKEAGIARSHDVALTGDDIAEYNDEELRTVLQTTRVFARVLPSQKMRIAQVLQASGEIVAMTGDGINDAPALRRAHIGVAIGSGTEVAKEASDLVLVNDSFTTIYAAIEEGRRIADNLKRIVGYLLSTSFSEAVLIGGALMTGAAVPILPTQILWANIIEEGLMSVAFAFEPGDKEAMKRKPRDIHTEGVFSQDMLRFCALAITVLSVLLLGLYAFLRMTDVSIDTLRSVMFVAVSLDSLFLAFSFRSLTTPVWHISLLANKFFIGSFIISLALLVMVLSIPFFQTLFSYQPLTLLEFGLVFVYAFGSMMVIEFGKHIFFGRRS
ncbi:HAD-IC family P-type ATPase [Candidatus Kaiserbacteria bacterium]|nr:HAD-IC family P-type ATPase [Candidatus Kaiserbacteria bacterium]